MTEDHESNDTSNDDEVQRILDEFLTMEMAQWTSALPASIRS
ncbi:MAG: hypothetical protein ACI9S9_004705, partial [Planctomycetota bacterium]